MTKHIWEFLPRFRRNAFGWRSDTPIKRIKEAVSEIRKVIRKDAVLAAEGAVLLLEKLSPALENVDSSSGRIGNAVNKAIEDLVPIICKAPADDDLRLGWLDRLWQALQDDEIPYIELLGDYWGDLCMTAVIAGHWADELAPTVKHVWSLYRQVGGYFKGTTPCLACMAKAGRYEALLALIEKAPLKWWDYRRWGVQALVGMGKKAEAIRYAEESQGLNDPYWQIAQTCEEILLSSGMSDEAYRRYGIAANQGSTYLATFRALAKKYSHKDKEDILRDLIASTPGDEGKWFAAAKDAGLFDVAIELVQSSPTDPRTLIRAARDFAQKRPDFALSAGIAALHWMSQGYGYEITTADVYSACVEIKQAANNAGIDGKQLSSKLKGITSGSSLNTSMIRPVIERYLLI